jgi:tetratricopeptide (TPR) repeat protein
MSKKSYLAELIAALNDKERQMVREAFLAKGKQPAVKSIEYLEAIFARAPLEKGAAEHTMVSRLFEGVSDVLLSEKYVQSFKEVANLDYVALRLRKRMILFRILFLNLNPARVEPLKLFLNSIESEAKAAEIYDVWMDALNQKKYFVGFRTGIKLFDQLNLQVETAERYLQAVRYALDCYFRVVISESLLRSSGKKEFFSEIKRMIRKMRADQKITKSQTILYYLLQVQMLYHEKQKKFSLAVKYCKRVLHLVESNPMLDKKGRRGFNLDNLSQYKTYMGRFLEAARHSKEAQKHYSEDSYAFLASMTQEFHVYFYHGKYDKAKARLQQMLDHSQANAGKFRRAKYIYYNANVLFMLGDFKAALSQLHSTLEIEKDKGGWNIALRVLTIMIFIELDKLDEASINIETLRKLVERTSKTEEVSQRDILIVKLLRQLEKEDFNFKTKSSTFAAAIRKLAEKEKPWSWEYYTPELIPVHKWLMDHRQGMH